MFAGKLPVAVNSGDHSIRVLYEMSVSDGGNMKYVDDSQISLI